MNRIKVKNFCSKLHDQLEYNFDVLKITNPTLPQIKALVGMIYSISFGDELVLRANREIRLSGVFDELNLEPIE